MHLFTILRTALLMLMLALGASAFAQDETPQQSWWEGDAWANPDRGFNWYPPDAPPPQKKPEKKPETKPEKPQAQRKPKTLELIVDIKELREELEWRRNKAIMEPTTDNMRIYLQANKFVLDKSSMFADMQRRVVWATPEFDYNTKSPSANFAQVEINQKKFRDESALMDEIAKTHGILFFYRSDCQFCHLQSPILKMIQDRYHVNILAISGDGGPINEFPNAKPDNGIGHFVTHGRGIETYPSMFLVSKDQRQVVPLGAGVVAMDEIVNRIYTLLRTQPNQNF